LLQQ